jgi:extracellular factor (EF) 3-hydroxypalmitic acid methyl ester biosynthesis protein
VAIHNSSLQSLVTFRNSQGEAARGTLLRLERSIAVFEVYNPYSIVQLSEVLQGLTIRRGDRVVYDGQAVVVNLVNTGLMLIVSATLVDGWKDLNGLLESGKGIKEEVVRFISDWTNANDLRPSYLLAVTALRGFLSELNRWLGQLELPGGETVARPSSPLSTEIYDEITTPLFPRLYDLFCDFEHAAGQIQAEEVIAHKRYVQHDLHPLLMTAPFVHRTFTKPLGYAGDYEMVNMMIEDSRKGPTIYAQLINSLHLKTGVAEAHRNRISLLKNYVQKLAHHSKQEGRIANILNVGCGPAKEIQDLVATNTALDACRFTLLDFNAETLDATRARLEGLAQRYRRPLDVNFAHASVHQLLKKATRSDADPKEKQYDMIYCAGLFDYLSDKVCSRLLKLFYRWLNPGGLILATNVHPSNPNRYSMEHILEWHLIYRDNMDMTRLCPEMGIQNTFCDATGINVFLEIKKPLPAHVQS